AEGPICDDVRSDAPRRPGPRAGDARQGSAGLAASALPKRYAGAWDQLVPDSPAGLDGAAPLGSDTWRKGSGSMTRAPIGCASELGLGMNKLVSGGDVAVRYERIRPPEVAVHDHQ